MDDDYWKSLQLPTDESSGWKTSCNEAWNKYTGGNSRFYEVSPERQLFIKVWLNGRRNLRREIEFSDVNEKISQKAWEFGNASYIRSQRLKERQNQEVRYQPYQVSLQRGSVGAAGAAAAAAGPGPGAYLARVVESRPTLPLLPSVHRSHGAHRGAHKGAHRGAHRVEHNPDELNVANVLLELRTPLSAPSFASSAAVATAIHSAPSAADVALLLNIDRDTVAASLLNGLNKQGKSKRSIKKRRGKGKKSKKPIKHNKK